MSETYKPLRANRPTLLDLWVSHQFDASSLAFQAQVPESTIDAMMTSQPVQQEAAQKVLSALSTRYKKNYTLKTVHVVLQKSFENMSEVARLMQQIDDEYSSALQGMQGLAQGIAQHAFRTARTEIEARYFEQLRQRLGDDLAMQIVFERGETEAQTNVT